MPNPLWLLVGPGGAGKTTLVAELVKCVPGLRELISTTTRPMRDGESQGSPYFFVSRPVFERRQKGNRFVQTVEFGGNGYGISRLEAEALLALGPGIAIVVGETVQQFRDRLPQHPVYSVYLDVDPGEACARMRGRGDSDLAVISRMKADLAIASYKSKADFVIQNQDLGATTQAMAALMKQALAA